MVMCHINRYSHHVQCVQLAARKTIFVKSFWPAFFQSRSKRDLTKNRKLRLRHRQRENVMIELWKAELFDIWIKVQLSQLSGSMPQIPSVRFSVMPLLPAENWLLLDQPPKTCFVTFVECMVTNKLWRKLAFDGLSFIQQTLVSGKPVSRSHIKALLSLSKRVWGNGKRDLTDDLAKIGTTPPNALQSKVLMVSKQTNYLLLLFLPPFPLALPLSSFVFLLLSKWTLSVVF